jgi:hypothetical protein
MKDNMLANDKDDPDSTGNCQARNASARLFALKFNGDF